MVSKWRKAKLALGCIQLPRTQEGDNNSNNILSSSSTADVVVNNNNVGSGIGIGEGPRRFSDAEVSPAAADCRPPSPLTPTPSSSGLRFSRNSSKSSKVRILTFIIFFLELFIYKSSSFDS